MPLEEEMIEILMLAFTRNDGERVVGDLSWWLYSRITSEIVNTVAAGFKTKTNSGWNILSNSLEKQI
jgi:hypothetical protein